MQRVIASGVRSGLRATQTDSDKIGEPEQALKRFLTYVNDNGAVHTIITDIEHVASTDADLLDWVNEARTVVEHLVPVGTPNEEVHALATERAGLAPTSTSSDASDGGAF